MHIIPLTATSCGLPCTAINWSRNMRSMGLKCIALIWNLRFEISDFLTWVCDRKVTGLSILCRRNLMPEAWKSVAGGWAKRYHRKRMPRTTASRRDASTSAINPNTARRTRRRIFGERPPTPLLDTFSSDGAPADHMIMHDLSRAKNRSIQNPRRTRWSFFLICGGDTLMFLQSLHHCLK